PGECIVTGTRLWLMLAVLITASGATAASPPAGLPVIGDGVASGDVTDTRAMIWTRTSGPASVGVEYHTSPTLGGITTPAVPAEREHGCTVKIDLSDLQPGTRYYYRITAEAGGWTVHSLVGTFRTAPAATETADLTLAWGADTSQRFQPFRIFDAVLAKARPRFSSSLGTRCMRISTATPGRSRIIEPVTVETGTTAPCSGFCERRRPG